MFKDFPETEPWKNLHQQVGAGLHGPGELRGYSEDVWKESLQLHYISPDQEVKTLKKQTNNYCSLFRHGNEFMSKQNKVWTPTCWWCRQQENPRFHQQLKGTKPGPDLYSSTLCHQTLESLKLKLFSTYSVPAARCQWPHWPPPLSSVRLKMSGLKKTKRLFVCAEELRGSEGDLKPSPAESLTDEGIPLNVSP